MKLWNTFVLTAVVIAAWAVMADIASASILTGESGATLGTGTPVAAENEGTVTLDPPFGAIECKESKVSGKTTNSGGEGLSVTGNIESLSFSSCNATITVLTKGTLSITGTGSSNGTLTSSGTEVTVEFVGTHCIFKTNSTTLGTVTGSETTKATATLDISATIPRTGGRSGAFCGSTAAWTGSYKFTAPDPLNVDSGSSEVVALFPGEAGPLTYTVGNKQKILWHNLTDSELVIKGGDVNHNGLILNTVGGLCTKIGITGTCENIEIECIRPGLATVTLGNPRVGTAVIRCD